MLAWFAPDFKEKFRLFPPNTTPFFLGKYGVNPALSALRDSSYSAGNSQNYDSKNKCSN
jgi:hypothetical protein